MSPDPSLQEHRHSYVRKNAVFAIYSIYKDFEHLIPDGPEVMQTFLAAVRLALYFPQIFGTQSCVALLGNGHDMQAQRLCFPLKLRYAKSRGIPDVGI